MLLFAMAPAFLTSGVDVVEVLHSGHRHGDNRRFRRLSDLLVTGQVALSVVVLSAAALVARSLINLERANLSLESSRVLIAELSVRYRYYDTAPKQLAAMERLLPAIAASPGVRSVSPVVAPPFSVIAWDGVPRPEGQSAREAKNDPVLNMELVAPSYFATFGIPVLQGRAFASDDRRGSTLVVMLSESAARTYWPGQNPIGRRLVLGSKADSMSTVVGCRARHALPRSARRSPDDLFPARAVRVSVRADITRHQHHRRPRVDRSIAPTRARRNDAGNSLVRAAPFDAYLSGPLAQPRLDATLLFVFAAAAVLLSAVGLLECSRHRCVSGRAKSVSGSRSERRPRAWRLMVLRRALVIGSVGVASGLGIVLLTYRWVASLLFGVSSTDAATLAVVAVFVLSVAGLASLLPARLSASVDPVVALRAE